MSKVGAPPIGGAQQVGANQRPLDPKRAFKVSWSKNTATINEVVKITGAPQFTVQNPSQLTVKILFNNETYQPAEKVEFRNGQVIAQWTVTPRHRGNFTAGLYDVLISYGMNYSGKTDTALRIIAGHGGHSGASSFVR